MPEAVPSYTGDRRTYEAAQLALARLSVAGGGSLADGFRETTRVAAETLGVERVGIWLFVDGGRAIRCHQLFERSKQKYSEGAVLCAADFPAYFAALAERRDVPAADARKSVLTSELADAYLGPLGIASMLDVPIYRGGEVVGVVCHEDSRPREWSESDRTFAVSVSDAIARQLEEVARRDAESQLREHEAHWSELEKMEALGRLAAGIAHDFRNLLTVVIGYADEIKRRSAEPRSIEAASEILATALRGSALIRELVQFGRDHKSDARVLDVADAVEAMAPVLRTAVGSNHPVEIRAERPIGRVLIDRSQLERVLLNLVLNARDAMPSGGTIEVGVREADVMAAGGESGTYVVVEVADTGVGMDREIQSRIFEPFFTTKPAGHGTGIGLAVVYRVVERCGGFLHVESEPGQGTRIRVYLPRVAAQH
jgi:signal transduction histidine kinase